MEELQPGDPPQIGPYLLLGRLGAGGMGRVFLGRSPGGRLVAVKVIRSEWAGDKEFRVRFGREVAAARRVGGAFTAPVMDADLEARPPWLVTSYVNGPSLTEAVTEHGALPVASVLALAAGLAEGLSAVHAAGVVHRDLKPSNVLLAADGPRLIDFGISQAADVTQLTGTGMLVGSPGFMSPEQAEGHPVGPASDVFSLGAVLAFAATGEGPFGVGTPSVQLYRVVHSTPRLDQLPGELRPLVERCLAKDPAQRPTAAQFLAELTAAHPAANLINWLPASILPATSSLPALTGHVHESSAQAPIHESSAPEPPAPDPIWPPTVSAVVQHPREEPVVTPAPGPVAMTSPGSAGTGPPTPWPESAGPGPQAPWPGIPSRPAGPSRRRRWAVPVIAAVAALGAVIGLLIAAPWHQNPPVLRPAGLAADASTVSSVGFRWSGPATGPAPDRYQILRDNRVVASVPGNVTFYRATGLDPGSSYQYRVVAIRGGKRSPESSVLNVSTATPPLSAAVLTDSWSAQYTVTAVINGYKGDWTVGQKWTDPWVFTPACASGPCNVKLSGSIYGSSFTASLNRAGNVYTGTTGLDNLDSCIRLSNHTHDTLHIRIQVEKAIVADHQWTAQSWAGTVTVDKSPNPNGGCTGETDRLNVAGND